MLPDPPCSIAFVVSGDRRLDGYGEAYPYPSFVLATPRGTPSLIHRCPARPAAVAMPPSIGRVCLVAALKLVDENTVDLRLIFLK